MDKIKYLLLALAFFMFVPFATFAEEEVEEATTEEVEDANEGEDVETTEGDTNEVSVYFFRGQGCPHCEEAEEWFKSIEEEHGSKFKIVDYETWYNEDNKEIFRKVLKARNEYVSDEESLGVPYIVIGDHSWLGFHESYTSEIMTTIESEYEKDSSERYDVMNLINNNSSNQKVDSSENNIDGETTIESHDNGATAALLIIVGIGIIVLAIALIPKYQKVKNDEKEKARFIKMVASGIGIFVVLVIVFLILSGGSSNEYLNARIKGCPDITLKEGLENLKSFYNKYNVDFTYKIKSGESESGVSRTYLYLNHMETIYDYNVYVPLELNDGVVSFSYVFRNGTVERGIVGGSASIEAALCGNYN